MKTFLACFIPLVVAIDPLGIIPVYLGLTKRMSPHEIRRVIAFTIATALALALLFVFLGREFFIFLGISEHDFKIAGGIILLLIALDMVLRGKEREERWDRTIGVVPLGVPLIVGPASLTTLLMQVSIYSLNWVLLSLVVNLAIIAIVFIFSPVIARVLGTSGMNAMSRIVGLFLTAIAVMMIRVGIQGAFGI